MLRKVLSSVFLLALMINTAFAELTLGELGFKKEEVKVDSKTMQMMGERKRKLQIHQKLGLVTAAAMTATLLLADEATGTGKSYNTNNAHKYAGITTGLLYWTTAYYSLSAPKPADMKDSGSTKIHEALAWVHAPLMALVPVLGYLHDQNNKKGKESTGIVGAHAGLATVAYLTFIAAGATMYFDF
jgi:cytochrome b561